MKTYHSSIENEESGFVTEECEKTRIIFKVEHPSDFIISDNVSPSSSTKTIIGTESEYLADGNLMAFESIIVKEEPRLNVCDEIANPELQEEEIRSVKKPSTKSNDKRKQTGRKKLERKSDETIFVCYICKCIAKNTIDLRKHIQAHAVRRSFTCVQCDRKFSKKSNLNRHERLHTGEKPFTCNQCYYTCSDKSTLNKHKLIHTGNKPYACDQCDQTCLRKATFKRHMQTHTGEKFACDQCNRKYSRKSNLNKHKRQQCMQSEIRTRINFE